jgi:hypothetical protein
MDRCRFIACQFPVGKIFRRSLKCAISECWEMKSSQVKGSLAFINRRTASQIWRDAPNVKLPNCYKVKSAFHEAKWLFREVYLFLVKVIQALYYTYFVGWCGRCASV